MVIARRLRKHSAQRLQPPQYNYERAVFFFIRAKFVHRRKRHVLIALLFSRMIDFPNSQIIMTCFIGTFLSFVNQPPLNFKFGTDSPVSYTSKFCCLGSTHSGVPLTRVFFVLFKDVYKSTTDAFLIEKLQAF